jgi:hypothetical protein
MNRRGVGDFQPQTPNLWDWKRQEEERAAYQAREAGIEQAMKGLDPFWEARVLLRIETALERWRIFTTDDLRDVASPPPNRDLEPLHGNHWSAFMVKWHGKLWRRLGSRTVSRAKQGHGNLTSKYESLRARPEAA